MSRSRSIHGCGTSMMGDRRRVKIFYVKTVGRGRDEATAAVHVVRAVEHM